MAWWKAQIVSFAWLGYRFLQRDSESISSPAGSTERLKCQ